VANHQADVIIVGGGMVGLTLALALGKALKNTKIVVFERNALSTANDDSPEQDIRVSAITRASQNIFRNLGCWDFIDHQDISSYDKMHVWDGKEEAKISFSAEEIAEPDLGHIIENRKIIHGLLKALKQLPNVQLFDSAKLKSAHWTTKSTNTDAILSLENNDHWHCKLLVAADGANSWLRTQRKLSIHSTPYEHDAIVCNIKTEDEHQSCAWQRFLETGPLALLPLKDKHSCSIVWSTSKQLANALMKMHDDAFSLELSNAFEHQLGALKVTSKRYSFPLVRRHADTYVEAGIALVGDAAHTIHPLAGQGVNLGLLDAACLAQVIENAVNLKQNYGLKQVLRPYERWRRSENIVMLKLMDFFKNIYASDQQTIVSIRSAGMNFLDQHNHIKNNIIVRAMGLKGDLPKLSHMGRDPNLDSQLIK